MRAIAGAALAALIGQSAAAQPAAPPACVTRAEMQTLIGFALPVAMQGLGNACRATLGPDAYLTRSGAALAQRYRSESGVSWAEARPLFERVSGEKMDKGLGEAVEKGIVEGVIGGLVEQNVKPRDCATVDLAVELLAPLPARNVGALTALLVEIGLRADAKKGKGSMPFAICRDSDRR